MNFAAFELQEVPPAPGRQADAPAAPARQDQPPAGQAPPPPGGGALGLFFPLLLVGMLIFLFWSSRSQQKKQETAIAGLKKGDRVLTQSGLVGRLVELEPKYVKIEIAPGVKVQILRTSLQGRDTDDTAKGAETSGKT